EGSNPSPTTIQNQPLSSRNGCSPSPWLSAEPLKDRGPTAQLYTSLLLLPRYARWNDHRIFTAVRSPAFLRPSGHSGPALMTVTGAGRSVAPVRCRDARHERGRTWALRTGSSESRQASPPCRSWYSPPGRP